MVDAMRIISAAIAAVALAGCAAALYAKKPESEDVECSCDACKRLPDGFTVTGHSGCMGTRPNSLESIKAAADNGADIAEIDLRFDENRVAVLSHNRVGSGEDVITLEDAFAVVAQHDKLLVNVDVKQTECLEQVQLLAEKYGILQRVFFTGVKLHNVPTVNEKCPLIPYYLNVDTVKPFTESDAYINRLIETVRSCGAVGVNISKTFVTRRFVKRFQDAGYPVSIWTASDKKELMRCLAMRPDNITTCDPALLCSLIKR